MNKNIFKNSITTTVTLFSTFLTSFVLALSPALASSQKTTPPYFRFAPSNVYLKYIETGGVSYLRLFTLKFDNELNDVDISEQYLFSMGRNGHPGCVTQLKKYLVEQRAFASAHGMVIAIQNLGTEQMPYVSCQDVQKMKFIQEFIKVSQ